MNWLRWHHNTSKDPKWRLISQKTGVSIPIVLSVWTTMLESASENQIERGVLQGWRADEVAASLDSSTLPVSPEQVAAVYDAMQGNTLDGNRLISWEKRNPKRERDDYSTERVKRHRKQSLRTKRRETPSNATEHPEERREEEIREEKKKGNGDSGAGAPFPEPLVKFGEYGHVLLTPDDAADLRTRLNGSLDDYIARLDLYGETNPAKFAKYRNHKAVIQTWYGRDLKGSAHGQRETDADANLRAAKDFVSRKLAETLRGDLPDVREEPSRFPRTT